MATIQITQINGKKVPIFDTKLSKIKVNKTEEEIIIPFSEIYDLDLSLPNCCKKHQDDTQKNTILSNGYISTLGLYVIYIKPAISYEKYKEVLEKYNITQFFCKKTKTFFINLTKIVEILATNFNEIDAEYDEIPEQEKTQVSSLKIFAAPPIDITASKEEKAFFEARSAELSYFKELKVLIDKSDLEIAMTKMLSILASSLLNIPKRLELECGKMASIRYNEEICEVLKNLSTNSERILTEGVLLDEDSE